mmetsp:Transcript_4324/g.9869  ORF Transcript_4324/g.9869 Transcript_4324/m.9869 type:complete len:260 (+) Transcript_4324:344-1123(+)
MSGRHSVAGRSSQSKVRTTGSFSCSKSRLIIRACSSMPVISWQADVHSSPGLKCLWSMMQGSCTIMSSPILLHRSVHCSISLQATLTSYLTTRSSGMVRTSDPGGHLWHTTDVRNGVKNSSHIAGSMRVSPSMVCDSSTIGTKKLSQKPHSPLNCFISGVSLVICLMRMTKNMSRPTLGSFMESSCHLRRVSEPLRKITISSQCSRGAAKANKDRRPKWISRRLDEMPSLKAAKAKSRSLHSGGWLPLSTCVILEPLCT